VWISGQCSKCKIAARHATQDTANGIDGRTSTGRSTTRCSDAGERRIPAVSHGPRPPDGIAANDVDVAVLLLWAAVVVVVMVGVVDIN
jgi:hypothetical protein